MKAARRVLRGPRRSNAPGLPDCRGGAPAHGGVLTLCPPRRKASWKFCSLQTDISAHKNPVSSLAMAVATTFRELLRSASRRNFEQRCSWAAQALVTVSTPQRS